MIALLVVLPLYTGQGYWQLGDTKYLLFRNVSLLCLGCWLLVGMPGRIGALGDVLKRSRKGSVQSGKRDGAGESKSQAEPARLKGQNAVGESRGGLAYVLAGRFSKMDCVVAAYGVCVALSALCSSYGQLAWAGYEGWYMGAVSQLMFVGIYFFVSRQYDGSGYPLYLGEGAFFLVTLFGLLHRLGIDPLGLQNGWNSGDWEYSHMLSTLGNINWLCGYYSVALAFAVVHFLREEKRWLQGLLYVEVAAGFVLLGIQGSQGGLLILAVCVVVCVLSGRRQPAVLQKIFMVLAGFFFCMPVMWLLMKLRGSKAAIVADGNVFDHVEWYGWVIAAVASLLLAFCGAKILRKKRVGYQRLRQKRVSRTLAAGMLLGIVAAGIAGMLYVIRFCIDDSFGSGRGLLWRIALESFGQSGIRDKLLGAGPDCYGLAVFWKLAAGTDVWAGEHWEGAVFTNAHNEFLSQLCNIGILGTASYLAVFLTGFCRYGWRADSGDVRPGNGNWLGVLALAMYGIHSLISFQQVLNTPLLFLVLGLCEARMRDSAEVGCLLLHKGNDRKGEESYEMDEI